MDFVKRPVAIMTVTAFLSFCILANTFTPVSILAPVIFGVSAAAFLWASYRRCVKRSVSVGLRYLFLIAAGLFLGSLLILVSLSGEEAARYSGCESEETALVRDVLWENDYGFGYKAEILGDESFFIVLDSREKLEKGSIVKGKIAFSALESGDTFDEKRYYMSKGMLLRGEADELKTVGEAKRAFSDFFDGINDALSDRLHRFLSAEAAALGDAVVLGNKGGLSREVKRDFSKIGISHLIAISGMHISYISTAFFGTMRRLRTPRRASYSLCILLMLFYMGITGFSASVTRAAILSCLLCAVYLIGLCHDGITALGVCGLGMVAVCPYFAFDVGMQLSFAAYLGCIAALSLEERLFGRFKGNSCRNKKRIISLLYGAAAFFRGIFIISVTVTLFTLPLVFLYYDSLSLISLITNLVFIPLFSLVMYAGAAVMLFSGIPVLGGAVSFISEVIMGLALSLSKWAAGLDVPTVSLRYPFSPFLIAAISLLAVLVICSRKRTSAVCAAFLALSVSAYGAGILLYNLAHRDEVFVARVDAVYGDGIVMAVNGETYLCDFSNGSASEGARALNCAAKTCEEDVDNIILTDISEGHLALLSKLCETSYVEAVYIPRDISYKKAELKERIELYLDEKGVSVSEYGEGDFDGVNFPFSLEFAGDEAALAVRGEKNGFLYVSGGCESYGSVARLIDGKEDFCVLFGKTSREQNARDFERMALFLDDCEVSVVVKKDFKESLQELTDLRLVSSDEEFFLRIKK